ncbi:7,8-dihydroneopterin aldolase [Moorella thermoacetica]|uniref:7,8-dihydroneopterin aldolase n=3 Tax=Neomoorella thermoacetica TaxID=1525 RepID=A0A1D7X7C1_NEOTH|nr:dihydroneopterin aldolase [Moorella thermoacetica]AKX93155.1 dihydroneopterin aldolase [Moorella thermoacetica]AKX95797.1 dihydroneopterin aldolase [Moorella thermoacetica]AOQ22813.1 Dihydroneopterin aldolase [Moorella thermoacetica]APC07496.1 dihydroneopterin aldolase [Moorella thermoacetica]OIQ08011.1 dihydroneopterin aldolase [Moorella thermoacetica]
MGQDKIILAGLEFYGFHGNHPAEQQLGQPFIVDLELYLDLEPAGRTDALEATVNYGQVYRLVQEIVTGRPYKLLEALAAAISDGILAGFPVDEVLVRVKKPRAPLPGSFDYAAVEIRRRRKE